MRTDELDALERDFGVILPPEYRAAMLAYPFGPDSDATEFSMPDDEARVHELNLRARAPSSRRTPWPVGAFVVGTDGSEIVYVLDTSRRPAVVQEFSVENGEFNDRAPDLATWMAELEQFDRDWAAEEAAMREAYRTRKWWQFWIRPYPPKGVA